MKYIHRIRYLEVLTKHPMTLCIDMIEGLIEGILEAGGLLTELAGTDCIPWSAGAGVTNNSSSARLVANKVQREKHYCSFSFINKE